MRQELEIYYWRNELQLRQALIECTYRHALNLGAVVIDALKRILSQNKN